MEEGEEMRGWKKRMVEQEGDGGAGSVGGGAGRWRGRRVYEGGEGYIEEEEDEVVGKGGGR